MNSPVRDDANTTKSTLALAANHAGRYLSVFNQIKSSLVSRSESVAATFSNRQVRSASPAATDSSEMQGWLGGVIRSTMLIGVLVPTLIAGIYFAFFASDQYVAEARVTVRAASDDKEALSDMTSAFSKLGISGGKSTIQDSYLIVNYAKSGAVVNDIGGRAYLEQRFSRQDIDWLSRLPTGKPNEDLLKYWLHRTAVSLDTLSGIVTIKIFAFRAEDAREIAQRVVDLSEQMINAVSERSRRNAVAEAEKDVALAEKDLARARSDMQVFRNQSVSIDPVAKASSIAEVIGKLMVERSEIENFVATFSGDLSPTSPVALIQKRRLESVDKQIADLRRQLTSTNSSDSTVATDLSKFEQLALQEKFMERKYSLSQSVLDKANQEATRQKLFIAVVSPPTLPQTALYPERFIDTLLIFLGALVFWGIFNLVLASVTDHVG